MRPLERKPGRKRATFSFIQLSPSETLPDSFMVALRLWPQKTMKSLYEMVQLPQSYEQFVSLFVSFHALYLTAKA